MDRVEFDCYGWGDRGKWAVIPSGNIVIKDVNDFENVAGVPAKKISERFSVLQQRSILDSCWWEGRDLVELKRKVHTMRDVEVFCGNETVTV